MPNCLQRDKVGAAHRSLSLRRYIDFPMNILKKKLKGLQSPTKIRCRGTGPCLSFVNNRILNSIMAGL
jgi:hypothetical protein